MGELDITDQRLHHVIGRGHQLQLIAFTPAMPWRRSHSFEQRCGHAVLFGEDMLAAFLRSASRFAGGPHGTGAFGPAFTQMKFTEREIAMMPTSGRM
jgi:hypothetical protein